jgi:hypothetical protein
LRDGSKIKPKVLDFEIEIDGIDKEWKLSGAFGHSFLFVLLHNNI